MISKTFENEFLKSLDLLNQEEQNKVLTYTKSLLKKAESVNQKLLQFAGAFDSKDIQEINAAIDAGCENIDKNEW